MSRSWTQTPPRYCSSSTGSLGMNMDIEDGELELNRFRFLCFDIYFFYFFLPLIPHPLLLIITHILICVFSVSACMIYCVYVFFVFCVVNITLRCQPIFLLLYFTLPSSRPLLYSTLLPSSVLLCFVLLCFVLLCSALLCFVLFCSVLFYQLSPYIIINILCDS